MSKEMIISVNGREKKIAILDNGRVTEFYIERGEENSGIAGNIYKGRVQRVLPGMQSAFVSIGLERDAFLYVSDFFDEEEEIERIVMEKSKKGSAEQAKREANDRIDRARAEREKQMDSAQEITEPIVEAGEDDVEKEAESRSTKNKRDKRGRGKKTAVSEEPLDAAENVEVVADTEDGSTEEGKTDWHAPVFEIEDSGFERIVDDAETGELFKDAYMQEAIIDQVRAIEFDMESTDEAEVGSLLASFEKDAGGFERIADDEESIEPTGKAKPKRASKSKDTAKTKTSSRSRTKKTTDTKEAVVEENVEPAEPAEAEPETPKKTTRKKSAAKPKTTRTTSARNRKKKTDKTEPENTAELADGEASVKESSDTAEMSVRRGGRGRRRGGRKRKDDITETSENGSEVEGQADIENDELVETADPLTETDTAEEQETADAVAKSEKPNNKEGNTRNNRNKKDRSRGRQDNRDDRHEKSSAPTISDLLHEGQEILVQIAKEPIAKKGARITSHIALPGRFLVYMPTIEHLGVSRKIESSNERGRLRTLIQRIKAEEDIPSGGFIVRTAGVGISEEDLRQDARYLVRTWLDIKKSSEKTKSPAMVHQDLDLVQRLLRDQLSDEFTAIRVDSEEEYMRTVEFINRIQPRMVNRIKLYTREAPILEAYGVQEEVDKALKPRVWLKSGGYLVINQTEALVAIDVNTGKFVGKGNARLEDTITRTNMEAVDEIARQIRLRDLGGIIVLDLIDMEDRRNRQKVSQALQEALASDKSPTKVLSFNDFGLIIMTRKRVKQSLERTMCSPCEYCEGAGWVKSAQTVCYEILAEARRLAKQMDDIRQTTLRVHPEVASALRGTERSVFEEIEDHLGNVDMTADKHIHQEQYDFAFI